VIEADNTALFPLFPPFSQTALALIFFFFAWLALFSSFFHFSSSFS
jgi:hypothetical protein